MEFLGIGVTELILIFVLALIVAGPQRMIAWAYTFGRWMSMIRRLWAQTAAAIQKEFDQAGLDVQIPKDLPTRGDLQREVGRVVNKYGAPLQEPLNEIKGELNATLRETDVRPDLAAVREAARDANTPTDPGTLQQAAAQEQADNDAKTRESLTSFKSFKPNTPAVARPVNGASNRMAEMGRSSANTATPPVPPSTPPPAPELGTWSSSAAVPPPPSPPPAEEPPADGFGTWKTS